MARCKWSASILFEPLTTLILGSGIIKEAQIYLHKIEIKCVWLDNNTHCLGLSADALNNSYMHAWIYKRPSGARIDAFSGAIGVQLD